MLTETYRGAYVLSCYAGRSKKLVATHVYLLEFDAKSLLVNNELREPPPGFPRPITVEELRSWVATFDCAKNDLDWELSHAPQLQPISIARAAYLLEVTITCRETSPNRCTDRK